MSDLTKITAFISANHVVGISSLRGSTPWAANCFYAFDPEKMTLLVMSELKTRHASEWADHPVIAGTISSQQSNVAKLQGVQFTGTAHLLDGCEQKNALQTYLKRFPFAALKAAPLWALSLQTVKFTDNTLGFGWKCNWDRSEQN